MSLSQVRQNFHEDCEDAINRQINMELFASYVYMSMVILFEFDLSDAIGKSLPIKSIFRLIILIATTLHCQVSIPTSWMRQLKNVSTQWSCWTTWTSGVVELCCRILRILICRLRWQHLTRWLERSTWRSKSTRWDLLKYLFSGSETLSTF